MRTRYFWLVAAVFILGVLLRGVEVANGNYLFGFDHGRDYLAVYNIVENHKQTLIGAEVGAGAAGLSGLFHGPGYYYVLSVAYRMFHGDPYGGLMFMFLFGVGAMIITFLTVRAMMGKTAALFALFFIAVSPAIVPQSRFIWNHHPTSFFIPIVLYAVYRMRDRPRIFFPVAVFVSGIIYNFELAIAVPLMVSVFVAAVFVYRVRDIAAYPLAILAAAAAFSPMIAFEARHGFMAVRGLLSYLGSNSGAGMPLISVWFRLSEHALQYWLNFRNTFFEGTYFPDLFQYAIAACLLWVAVRYLRRERNTALSQFFLFLTLTLVVSWVFFLFLNNVVWDYYLIHLHFVYIYLLAYAIALFLADRGSVARQKAYAFIAVFLFALGVGTANRLITDYRYDYFDYGGFEKIKGKKAAIDFVYADAGGKPFSAFVFMPAIYTYPYDYLFLTYGKRTYGYAPGQDKRGIAYLIIEPDPAKPWTYKGWQETVMAGGVTEWTKKIPSGQIVEKRVYQ